MKIPHLKTNDTTFVQIPVSNKKDLIQRLWKTEKFKKPVPYLPGPYPIYNRVHHGWNQKVDVSHKYVDRGSHIVPKPVGEKREEGKSGGSEASPFLKGKGLVFYLDWINRWCGWCKCGVKATLSKKKTNIWWKSFRIS